MLRRTKRIGRGIVILSVDKFHGDQDRVADKGNNIGNHERYVMDNNTIYQPEADTDRKQDGLPDGDVTHVLGSVCLNDLRYRRNAGQGAGYQPEV